MPRINRLINELGRVLADFLLPHTVIKTFMVLPIVCSSMPIYHLYACKSYCDYRIRILLAAFNPIKLLRSISMFLVYHSSVLYLNLASATVVLLTRSEILSNTLMMHTSIPRGCYRTKSLVSFLSQKPGQEILSRLAISPLLRS